ncbi:MAG: C40 family peptidase [Flavobacteriales bacterium Tduv]
MKLFVKQYKKVLTIIFFCFPLSSCGTSSWAVGFNTSSGKKRKILTASKKSKKRKIYPKKSNDQPKRPDEIQIKPVSSAQIDQLVEEAKSYLGTPYQYGGNSREGIDCSSFIINVFKLYNVTLPRISSEQAREGASISKDQAKKGDLLFFATGRSKKRINHVGIVVETEDEDILFIHASSSGGVSISRIKGSYWEKKFIVARRILSDELTDGAIELTHSDSTSQKSGFSSQEDVMFDQ